MNVQEKTCLIHDTVLKVCMLFVFANVQVLKCYSVHTIDICVTEEVLRKQGSLPSLQEHF